MKLHESVSEFRELSQLTSEWNGLSENAIKRDYLIVMILQKLSISEYSDKCIFKGGTSLSKCYEGTIERFSEDIDLTFIETELSDKQKEKHLKKIEEILCTDLCSLKINRERSKTSKSSGVWISEIGEENLVKLEIGSKIRPEPSKKLKLKTYIQEFLEMKNQNEIIEKYELKEITVLVLDITRTFLDKVLAVKRHAYNNDLARKVRHIYDVVKLFEVSEVKMFLENKTELKELLLITKQTDQFYLNKRRDHSEEYDPESNFEFNDWKEKFNNKDVKVAYEKLHINLLYTNEKQNFNKAIKVFEDINELLKGVEGLNEGHL